VSLDYYARATEILERNENFELLVLLVGRQAYSNLLVGNLSDSLAQAERAVELVGGETRDERVANSQYIFLKGFRALPLTYLGELQAAARIIDQNIEEAMVQGEIGTLASMRGFAVSNAWFLGDAQRAMRAALAQLEFSERVGSPGLRVMAYDSLGVGYLLDGRWEDSVKALETSLQISRESGVMRQAQALVLANLAEAYRRTGDFSKASELAREAVTAAEQHRTAMHECRANLILGRVLVRNPDKDQLAQAEPPLRRALEIVARTGAKAYEPFVRVELAHLDELRGNIRCACEHREKAIALFQAIGSSCCGDGAAAS
jgi:tetratricopeptide (TPR) repeat protein